MVTVLPWCQPNEVEDYNDDDDDDDDDNDDDYGDDDDVILSLWFREF